MHPAHRQTVMGMEKAHRLPLSRSSRIASWYSDASIEDESRWDEYQSWLVQRLVAMERVLRPVVRALP